VFKALLFLCSSEASDDEDANYDPSIEEIMIKYGSNGKDEGVQESPSTNTAPATLAAAESQFQ
jgi:hypothetical protein